MAKKIPFILNDPTVKNSHGFYVDTSGISMERFKKNPVCLKDHSNQTKDVLGTWLDLKVDANDILKGAVQFDTKDPDGLEVARKVENKTIKGSSLGLGLGMNKPNFKMIEGRLTLISSELKEISIVPVGSSGNTISLYDNEGVLLSDDEIQEICLSAQKTQKELNTNNMKLIINHLQLSDNATETETLIAIKGIENQLSDAVTKRDEYKLKFETLEQENADALKAEFDEEVALALKDGRLDEDGKQSLIELSENKPENALNFLKGLPRRKSIADRLENDETKLSDFDKMTWDELDKKDKLPDLKLKHNDYYVQRFEKEFGTKPNS